MRNLGALPYDPSVMHQTPQMPASAPGHAPPYPAPAGMGVPASGSPARGLGSQGGPSRKAWKKSGPTIGKASGLLLLALAGLVILGGLFVVFSLLE